MGSRRIAVKRALAGPVGSRRPCSPLRNVPTSTCSRAANFGWLKPSLERSALMARGSTCSSREGLPVSLLCGTYLEGDGDYVYRHRRAGETLALQAALPSGPVGTVGATASDPKISRNPRRGISIVRVVSPQWRSRGERPETRSRTVGASAPVSGDSPENMVATGGSDGFLSGCIVLLIWGLLVASCSLG